MVVRGSCDASSFVEGEASDFADHVDGSCGDDEAVGRGDGLCLG